MSIMKRKRAEDAADVRVTKHPNMQYAKLGNGGPEVSRCCLGTMTWGEQNTEEEAWSQLDKAVAAGVNFIDTAELYPVPPKPESIGRTEKYIGRWLKARPAIRREDLIIATKISGPGYQHIVANRYEPNTGKSEHSKFDYEGMRDAVEGSLRRMQTEYIDIFYLHWPERYAPNFGSSVFVKDNYEARKALMTGFEETLGGLDMLLKAGKIKHWAISNETCWGTTMWCETAKKLGVPLPVCIQNDFSLCDRMDETHLAEALFHYDVTMVPYGALAGGTLSGKYLPGAKEGPAPNARHVKYKDFQPRYFCERTQQAAAKYHKVAEEAGMTLTQLALRWVDSRWYVGSVIIGATTDKQLEECLSAWPGSMPESVDAQILEIHQDCRNPNLVD